MIREDVVSKQRKPAPLNASVYETAPVVILNNFRNSMHLPHVALMESTFQSMFPAVQVHTFQPSALQRVVLFQYDSANDVLEARHYWVSAKAVGLSKTVKKLYEGRLPTKLGSAAAMDEVLDCEGAWSDTDGEGEEVSLAQPFRNLRGQCRVKLVEIGPRMTLRLLKIEAGFGEGEVLYHAHHDKTPAETAELAFRVRRKSSVKAKRRAEQQENVAKKQQDSGDKGRGSARRRLDSSNGTASFEEARPGE